VEPTGLRQLRDQLRAQARALSLREVPPEHLDGWLEGFASFADGCHQQGVGLDDL